MRKTMMLAAAAVCGACIRAAPSASPAEAASYVVQVENATGVDLKLGCCGQRDCGELGGLAAGETRRFTIPEPEGPGVTLFGKEGDRWVARQRVDLLRDRRTLVSLGALTR